MRLFFMGFTLFGLGAWGTSAEPLSTPVGDPIDASCELHVWPATRLGSIYYGWAHGGIVDGAQTGRPGYPQIPADPLPQATQIELLKAVRAEEMTANPNSRMIVHDEPLAAPVIRAATGRLSDSPAPCYVELIVEAVKYQQDVFSGNWLNMVLRYRRFGTAPAPTRVFGSFLKTQLVHFPPHSVQDQSLAEAEMKQAYVRNIAEFSAALVKNGAGAPKQKN